MDAKKATEAEKQAEAAQATEKPVPAPVKYPVEGDAVLFMSDYGERLAALITGIGSKMTNQVDTETWAVSLIVFERGEESRGRGVFGGGGVAGANELVSCIKFYDRVSWSEKPAPGCWTHLGEARRALWG